MQRATGYCFEDFSVGDSFVTAGRTVTESGAADMSSLLEDRGRARYMWPESVPMFREFPQTPSLKVKKSALVEGLMARGSPP
jgi:hypothetical protein